MEGDALARATSAAAAKQVGCYAAPQAWHAAAPQLVKLKKDQDGSGHALIQISQ